ncbi:MAG: PD-(D/E)XK nuclease-like domain-containing protein, partial [Oscillospiraceae bacterium]|nr:PD-(D/E)XK nuclease-like domain-containing protein [Oscillospiraceae bacterium]
LAEDELARLLLSGRHQVIKTGKVNGVRYKAKIDSLLSPTKVERICRKFPKVRDLVPLGGPMIVDLKYMRDFEPIWSEEYQDKIAFAEFWGYDYQGAIYQALDKRSAPFVIVAATKETEADIGAFYIPDDALLVCLAEVEENSPRYDAIKKGKIQPTSCGKCAYCRRQRKLQGIKHYREVL